jgi:heme/copper-type cytochrome/quinol oxidase subunit 2
LLPEKGECVTIKKRISQIYLACFLLFILSNFQSSISSAEKQLVGEFVVSGELKNGIREVKIIAYKYGFFPSPLVVKHGERVRLIITAADVTHGIHIPEFKVNKVLPKGAITVVEFTASQKGQFMVHCSVYCGPYHGKQKARLIVK